MNLKCMFGFHQWVACTCSACGGAAMKATTGARIARIALVVRRSERMRTSGSAPSAKPAAGSSNRTFSDRVKYWLSNIFETIAMSSFDKHVVKRADESAKNLALLSAAKSIIPERSLVYWNKAQTRMREMRFPDKMRCTLSPSIVTERRVRSVLLRYGADINARDSNGLTGLHHAARIGFGIVKCLLRNAADIDARDSEGFTALHYAAFLSSSETAKLLVLKGADKNMRTTNGETPFDIVKREHVPGLNDFCCSSTTHLYWAGAQHFVKNG